MKSGGHLGSGLGRQPAAVAVLACAVEVVAAALVVVAAVVAVLKPVDPSLSVPVPPAFSALLYYLVRLVNRDLVEDKSKSYIICGFDIRTINS